MTNIMLLLLGNSYQENKCLDALEDMRQCCLKFSEKSFCCQGISLDKIYKERDTNDNPKKDTRI